MKISIIIPYYNADKWIGRMLDSLLKQELSREDYEIIVVDDGSKEYSFILKDYVQRHSNIIYVRQENAGPGAARNKGLEVARGDYIFFCDSDDFVAENSLSYLYDIAHSRSLDMLFFCVPRISEAELMSNPKRNFDVIMEFPTGKDFFALPIEGGFRSLGLWQFLISRSLICDNNLRFPSDMIMNEDACFLIDAILLAGKTAKVEADIYFYVQHPDSLIHYSGKILRAEMFTSNRLTFIKKLDRLIKDQNATNQMPKSCLDNLIWLKNKKTYTMLFEACKYLPAKQFNNVLYELAQIKSYPKTSGIKRILLSPTVMRMINLYMIAKRKMNLIKSVNKFFVLIIL